jgi:hypothetical protein
MIEPITDVCDECQAEGLVCSECGLCKECCDCEEEEEEECHSSTSARR